MTSLINILSLKKLSIRQQYVCLTLVFILTSAWFGLWSISGVDPHHDGIILKPVTDVVSGQMLYRESFNQYGALTVLFQALPCLFFGCTVLTLHLFTSICYGGIGVLLAWISLRYMRPLFVVLGVLFPYLVLMPYYWVVLVPWSSVYSLFFSLLTLAYLLKILEENTSKWQYFVLGALSILPFWFRQPLGLIMPATAMVLLLQCWVLHQSIRNAFWRMFFFSLGILAISAPLLLWIVWNGAFYDFWLQNFQFAARFSIPATGNPMTKLFLISENSLFFLFFYKMLLIEVAFFCGWLLIQAFHQEKRTSQWVSYCGITMIAVVSLHQYFPIPCIYHVYYAGVVSFIILGILLEKFWECWSGKLARVIFLGFFVGLPVLQFYTISFVQNDYWPRPDWRLEDLHRITEPGPLRNMWIHQRDYDLFWKPFFERATQLPEKYRDRPILNLTSDAIYSLCFSNQKNWHPMYVNWGDGIYPDYTQKALERLQKKDCIVICANKMVEKVRECGYTPVKINEDVLTFYMRKPTLYIAFPQDEK